MKRFLANGMIEEGGLVKKRLDVLAKEREDAQLEGNNGAQGGGRGCVKSRKDGQKRNGNANLSIRSRLRR